MDPDPGIACAIDTASDTAFWKSIMARDRVPE